MHAIEMHLKDYRVLFFCGVWQREQCQVVCAICEIIPALRVWFFKFYSGFKAKNEANTVSQIRRIIYSSGTKLYVS